MTLAKFYPNVNSVTSYPINCSTVTRPFKTPNDSRLTQSPAYNTTERAAKRQGDLGDRPTQRPVEMSFDSCIDASPTHYYKGLNTGDGQDVQDKHNLCHVDPEVSLPCPNPAVIRTTKHQID